ncbi:MAG: hypothetical protein NC124_02530 [Clostridium sp.]|nr:hypothetical protein [Clostridium sp.]
MSYLEELLPEFRKGAKIRRKDWDEDVFIYFYKDEVYIKDSGAWKDGKIASTKDLVSIFTIRNNDWELYQEPIDWDYIIKNKCLCCFWDEDIKRNFAAFLEDVIEDTDYKFKSINGTNWRNCHPVRRDEVTFYEDREDDI